MERERYYCGYARVSTKGQKLDVQIDKIQKFCDYKEINCRMFSEQASAVKDRPVFETLIKDIDSFEGLIVTKLDRLGRSVQQLNSIYLHLKDKNKPLIIIDQNIDTTKTEGKLMFQMLSVIAEFERDIIRDRLHSGQKFSGKYGGRHKKELPKETIIEHYKKGASYEWLSNTFNVSKNTIYRRLKEWGILKTHEHEKRN